MMYAALASVYDRLADDFDYDAWARYYARTLKELNPGARTLIDCGCGTGSLAVRFAAMGFSVSGVDISEDMLMQAARKARDAGVNVRFIRQDMRALAFPSPSDALVCACDGVNYLTNDRALNAFFESAFRALKPGGALAFDVSNLGKLRGMGEARLYGEDRDDLSYLWFNEWNEAESTLVMKLSCFARDADGRYTKFTETHVQRAHRVDDLARALARAGFEDIRISGGDEGESEGPGGARAYISARRP